MRRNMMLSFLLLVDNSGSMYGEKILGLNFAVSNMISSFKHTFFGTDIRIAIITCGGAPALYAPFTPAPNIDYQYVNASGGSFLTEALSLAKSVMTEKTAVIFFSDGLPNDGGFERGLNELELKTKVFAVSIGYDADHAMLRRFTKDEKHILKAMDTYDIAEYLIAKCNETDSAV